MAWPPFMPMKRIIYNSLRSGLIFVMNEHSTRRCLGERKSCRTFDTHCSLVWDETAGWNDFFFIVLSIISFSFSKSNSFYQSRAVSGSVEKEEISDWDVFVRNSFDNFLSQNSTQNSSWWTHFSKRHTKRKFNFIRKMQWNNLIC